MIFLFYRRPASHIHGYSPMAHPGTIASSFYQTCILRSPSLLSEKRSISSTHIHHHIVVLNYSQVASKPLHPRKGPFPNWRTRDSTADRADSRLHRNYLSISHSKTHHTYPSTILFSFLSLSLSLPQRRFFRLWAFSPLRFCRFWQLQLLLCQAPLPLFR